MVDFESLTVITTEFKSIEIIVQVSPVLKSQWSASGRWKINHLSTTNSST